MNTAFTNVRPEMADNVLSGEKKGGHIYVR